MKPKIVCVVGPTGSGKTDLAIEIARRYNGEVVSADSKQVYTDMEIVSNKPAGIQKGTIRIIDDIPHHLIGYVSPNSEYTLHNWLTDARHAINDIILRNKLPIIAGGTPIYVTALTENYELDEKITRESEYEHLIIAIEKDREELYKKIDQRVYDMVYQGLVEEARDYLKKYGDTHLSTSLTAHGYKHLFAHINGKISLDRALTEMQKDTRHYAKRQMTWWRHHGKPLFVSSIEEALTHVHTFLQK